MMDLLDQLILTISRFYLSSDKQYSKYVQRGYFFSSGDDFVLTAGALSLASNNGGNSTVRQSNEKIAHAFYFYP